MLVPHLVSKNGQIKQDVDNLLLEQLGYLDSCSIPGQFELEAN